MADLQSQGYESWNDAGRFFDPIKYCGTDCWMLYALTLQLHNNAYINYFILIILSAKCNM